MIKLNSKNKGFTLIEILLVVGFIALASVGVYTIYSKVQLSSAANTESRNLDTIRAGVKQLYGASSAYDTVTNTVVNAGRLTPENMKTAGDNTKITNSFGGSVVLAPANLGGGTNNGFTITYNNVPGAVCSRLVMTGGSQFDRVLIGGSVAKEFGENRVKEDVATIACDGAPNNGITVVFSSI